MSATNTRTASWLLDGNVPDAVKNRAWYELAKAFYHKGYPQAAKDALGRIEGNVPQDLRGDHQLLLAHVLMSLNQNREAARILKKWKGPSKLAGYAYYNRGIALLRVGESEDAIDALRRAAEIEAQGEELLSLKDKANLSLGYAFLRRDELERSLAHLQKVRLQGPFSNRALLAVGWIAQKQGRTDEALVPWMELSSRTLADPTVQEALLAVPFAHRELRALDSATHHYEVAVASFSEELRWLDETMEALRRGETINSLLRDGANGSPGSGMRHSPVPNVPEARYFGQLRASRIFRETARGHSDLQSMLDNLDKGLDNVDVLAKVLRANRRSESRRRTRSRSSQSGADRPRSPAPGHLPGGESGARAVEPSPPGWALEWDTADPLQRHRGDAPRLPQLELPAEGSVEGLPQSELIGLPEPEFIGLPESEVVWLPDSEPIGLPESEALGLPDTERFQFRQPNDDESFYEDDVRVDEPQPLPPRRLTRRMLPPSAHPALSQYGEPAGEALGELAAALGRATGRLDGLVNNLNHDDLLSKDLEGRIAALRERIVRLRARTADAIGLYEGYAKALALDELGRRQGQLARYLEQARLELAKTYDLGSGE